MHRSNILASGNSLVGNFLRFEEEIFEEVSESVISNLVLEESSRVNNDPLQRYHNLCRQVIKQQSKNQSFSQLVPKAAKKRTGSSGFACTTKTISERDYQPYTINLRKRLLTDNSEMLWAVAKILIPKHLEDRTGESRKRDVWDAFAISAGYCLLFCQEAKERGCNQLFVLSNKGWLVKRAEFQEWDEGDKAETYVEKVTNDSLELASVAAKYCIVKSIEWFDIPQIA